MNAPAPETLDWTSANQRWLVAGFERLRLRLRGAEAAEIDAAQHAIDAARDAMNAPPALDVLARCLDLSPFERELVLLCAAAEMDGGIARLLAQAQDRAGGGMPNFGAALALLEAPHWSALAPQAPLRRHRVIEPDPALPLSVAPLRLDERVLHFLAGINALDTRLSPMLMRRRAPTLVAPSHRALARHIAQRWEQRGSLAGVVLLHGDDASGQEDVAAAAASAQGRQLWVLRQDDVPHGAREIDAFVALWEREARLLPACLLVQCADDPADAATLALVERLDAPLFLALRDPVALRRGASLHEVARPLAAEQAALWREALDLDAGAPLPVRVASGLRLSARDIAVAARALDGLPDADTARGETAASTLWSAASAQARRRMDSLATRIEPRASWDDLVLPDAALRQLRGMAAQLRHREQVFGEWGFAARSTRGLGMAALFCGESGTGKTLAAEVLARELALDLYRVDLSGVVSKYIGETEKNLRRVFDAAEDSAAILLFDEADALFGKRSEVRDSHDRYANIEVGYLLARMESYRGLAILTTNLKSALDPAFLRRLRYVVQFPFPDHALRARLWRSSLPQQAPAEALDFDRLARLHMPGGAIRNIALNAAFLAAESGRPIGMSTLLEAARGESAKLERPLAEAETRGWV